MPGEPHARVPDDSTARGRARGECAEEIEQTMPGYSAQHFPPGLSRDRVEVGRHILDMVGPSTAPLRHPDDSPVQLLPVRTAREECVEIRLPERAGDTGLSIVAI